MTPTSSPLTSPLGELAAATWMSDDFVAGMFKQGSLWRLSIARAGAGAAPMSWEDLMKVKRDCGFGEQDALEVYPSDEDIFNTGNIRHLYFVGPVAFALRKNTHVLQQSNTHE
jgi:hypothetical protein